jgi:hypothetical protein
MAAVYPMQQTFRCCGMRVSSRGITQAEMRVESVRLLGDEGGFMYRGACAGVP